MICYKDKTFCVSSNCKCGRELTDKIKQEAEAFGLPLALANFCDDRSVNEWLADNYDFPKLGEEE